MLHLDPHTTALVLIDLQKGVIGRTLEPHSGESVIALGQGLADAFRAAGATVVLVNVAWSPDARDVLRQAVDRPPQIPPGGFPAHFSELVDGLKKDGDICITKRQWGAFHGTELDLQLRRRGITTIVLGGVSTNIGVESTARQAWELGYALVVAEDATSSRSKDMHAFSMTQIMPLLSRVVAAADISLSS